MVVAAVLLAAATVVTSGAASVSFAGTPMPNADVAIQVEQLVFAALGPGDIARPR